MILFLIAIACLCIPLEALSVAPSKLQRFSTFFASRQMTRDHVMSSNINTPTNNDGNWIQAKQDLQKKECCVVSIDNIQSHLEVLQSEITNNGPSDVDLRARIRTSSSDSSIILEDCSKVLESVLGSDGSDDGDKTDLTSAALALQELAMGVASMAEGSFFQNESGGIGTDVFCRIVCASNYRAREPPYHTDKAPFRGYATLRGVGTEYLNRPSSPLEYLQLRTFGEDGIDADAQTNAVCSAQELQFIVMKGDYYYDFCDEDLRGKEASSFMDKVWTRSRACLHRSPSGNGQRRVIVSFDLDDGNDDREWYQAGTKREWRNGLTQRKSRLVA